jgi:hypothetical protein
MRDKLYYLADWLGYTRPNGRTCEPAENVVNAPQLLEEFHRIYPNKPGLALMLQLVELVIKGGRSYHEYQHKNVYMYI